MTKTDDLPQPQSHLTPCISNGFKRALNPLGVLYPTLNELRNDFFTLHTEEARRAFAARWVSLLAPRLEASWQILYELLRLIQKYKLYTDLPKGWDPVKREVERAVYADFKTFFEAEIKRPFTVFQELEQTYRFASENAPDFMLIPLNETAEPLTLGRRERIRAAAWATPNAPLSRSDNPIPPYPQRRTRVSERANVYGIGARTQSKLDYLAHHDQTHGTAYLEQVRDGTLSVRKAYQQARHDSDKTPPEHLRYWWHQANDNERRQHANTIRSWLHEVDGTT